MDDHKHDEGNLLKADQSDMDHTALSMGKSDDDAKDIEADIKMTEDRIRIHDVNITMEMNTSQTVIQQQEGIDDEVPMNGYNLRNHPTKHTQRVSMAQTRQDKSQEWKAVSSQERRALSRQFTLKHTHKPCKHQTN